MKVVVTGVGLMTSLGHGVESVFSHLLANKTGVVAMPEWRKYVGLKSYLGAPVGSYDNKQIPRVARRTMSRMSEMAVLATGQALKHADIILDKDCQSRTAILMGSTSGSPEVLEQYFKKLIERGGPEGQLSTSFFKCMNHSVASNVAVGLDYFGPLISPSSACSTSGQAMVLGWELLQTGLYDRVIAGGADELMYTSTAVFDIVQAASRQYNDSPEKAPRPFDVERDGLVVSEGAAAVVLETADSAKNRRALPLAEICGGAYLCDGSHMSQPKAPSMKATMEMALKRSKIDPEQIDYINAHATGTLLGDVEESQAVSELVGNHRPPISSLKGHFGHSLAACGGVELILSIEMMRKGCLIPTRNLEKVDPNCADLNYLTEVKSANVKHVLTSNFAFGGMNTSLVVSAAEGAPS